MKLKIVLFGLCLSYALMAISFSAKPTGSCTGSKYTFTLTGETTATVVQGAATVTLSSPVGVTPTCTVPDVEVSGRLRNLAELTVTCEITSPLTGATITVTKVSTGGVDSAALDLSVDGSVTCPAATPATPVTPVTIGTSKLKVSSVSGTSVVVAITLDTAEDASKVLTAAAAINGLKLVDSSTFEQALTCNIAAGTIPSSVTCTMTTAATSGTKYKLSGTAAIASTGTDEFGAVTVQADEVTATDPPSGGDNTPTNISSWIKNSVMLFIFTLLF